MDWRQQTHGDDFNEAISRTQRLSKNWSIAEQIELVLAVESDKWKVADIENWLRPRVKKV